MVLSFSKYAYSDEDLARIEQFSAKHSDDMSQESKQAVLSAIKSVGDNKKWHSMHEEDVSAYLTPAPEAEVGGAAGLGMPVVSLFLSVALFGLLR